MRKKVQNLSNCAKCVKYVKLCQIIPDMSDSTLVRSVLQARYSSQLQLSSGLGMLPVSPCAPDLSNRSKDFANFWSEVRYRYSEEPHRALFSKKIF